MGGVRARLALSCGTRQRRLQCVVCTENSLEQTTSPTMAVRAREISLTKRKGVSPSQISLAERKGVPRCPDSLHNTHASDCSDGGEDSRLGVLPNNLLADLLLGRGRVELEEFSEIDLRLLHKLDLNASTGSLRWCRARFARRGRWKGRVWRGNGCQRRSKRTTTGGQRDAPCGRSSSGGGRCSATPSRSRGQ